MFNMQKTTFGSRFMFFEKDSIWYDAIFKNYVDYKRIPVDPAKRYKEYGEWQYLECDEIVILQIQQIDNKFMIEYVYK